MAIKFLNLKIFRGEGNMHVIVEKFAAWEYPILEAVHTAVEILGEVVINRDPPEAEDEFQRLVNRYGRSENEDGSKGIPYAAAVFGQHMIGIATLRREIEKATVSAAPETGDDLLGSLA